MTRRLGIEIAGRLFFAHPVKSARGFFKYYRYLSERTLPKVSTEIISLFHPLLIGAYCQKPNSCPAKRFNHRCLFAETLITYPACKKCELKKMVELAMMLKCPFYIMTTALDVLLDVFLTRRFPFFLVMICGYARELFLFPAFVFDMKGRFLLLGKGSCRSYWEFLLADQGHKSAQTHLSPFADMAFMKLYNQIKTNTNNRRKLIFRENFYQALDISTRNSVEF